MKKSTPKTKTSKNPAPKLAAIPAKNKALVKKSAGTPKAAASSPPIKKVAAKKAVTKKVVVSKALSKKAAVNKTLVKKPSLKKTVAKMPVKPVAKKTVTKKAVAKRPVTKTTPLKKTTAKAVPTSTKAELRKTIANLESRMKRADTLTRKSVKALESAVMTLDARTRKDKSTSKAALTRKVNQLSAKLTEMVEKTQADVNSELKTALNNPTVGNVQAALSRADQRLSSAEQAQASAITKVNRHLASIATAVDARIEEEAIARKAAITALKVETENNHNALTLRLDTIESDTAKALAGAGDKIAELSEQLTHRGEASELSIREKVSEIALQTQTEFETYRSGLERRIDDIAQSQSDNQTQRMEQSIASLTARLEGLEYEMANTPPPQTQIPEHRAPQLSVVASQTIPHATEPQELSSDIQSLDAFSPMPQLATTPAAAMPNPYLAAQAEPAPAFETQASLAETTGPVEFNPNHYSANQADVSQTPPPPAPTQEPLRDFTQEELVPSAPFLAEQSQDPTLDQAIPYSDPAYAEADPTMDRIRIGGENVSKFKIPKLSGRNLRVAALATGVAVVGLVAAKGVFGGTDAPLSQQKTAQNVQTIGKNINDAAQLPISAPDTSAAPIGNYADNKAVNVTPSSDAAKTLNSAASAGDPVAQFQLGLSYLEQGRTDEGVSLIRKSANQNQPAAQYRLAKLYEIGEGVSQDSEMARQLTERAARNGNRIAMHDLALYYAEGRGGVEADLPTAAKWFEKAAERGVVDSQFNLGVLFESGQGMPKNVTDAFVWYSIAASQGDQFAKTRVEVLKETLDQNDLVAAASRTAKFKPVKIDETANGIFRNVAWAKSNKTKAAGEKVSQVRQAQTMLSELGYEIGGADGSVGPKTRAAIISFERANSLPETGRVNASLIDRLELATGA